MSNKERPRPSFWEFIPYAYGRRTYGKRPLPAKYQAWVREDNAGSRSDAPRRLPLHASRRAHPVAVPADPSERRLGTAVIVTLPIFLGALYLHVRLRQHYRRATLQRNGLDPALADETVRLR